MKQAYFCTRIKNNRNPPEKAIKLAKKIGYKLWMSEKEVSDYGYPKGALQCKRAIESSDIVICQPPIGRDCAWELGFAHGLGKKIYVLGKLDKGDWMTKIGVEYV